MDLRGADIREDERDYISRSMRCANCGHLEIFHEPDEEFCGIPNCTCDISARLMKMAREWPHGARSFVTDNRLPEIGTQVIVRRLSSTLGFTIKTKHLDARRVGPGVYVGPVPGHGGDVVWVQHDPQTIGAYDTRDLIVPPTVREYDAAIAAAKR